MSDERLQALERRWRASGAPADEAELLRERVRAGTLAPRDLELAAYLEHPGARLAAPEFALPPGYRSWLSGLSAWSDRLALRGYALVLAALAGDAHPEHRAYFLAAAEALRRGEAPSNHDASVFFREHPAGVDRGGWQLALGGFGRPRRYLPADDPERRAALVRLRAQPLRGIPGPLGSSLPPMDPEHLHYRRTERPPDGWVHVFSWAPPEGAARLVRPLLASRGWTPPPGCEGAPPGHGLLDTLRWDLPDTPALRAAVRDALVPEVLGWASER